MNIAAIKFLCGGCIYLPSSDVKLKRFASVVFVYATTLELNFVELNFVELNQLEPDIVG